MLGQLSQLSILPSVYFQCSSDIYTDILQIQASKLFVCKYTAAFNDQTTLLQWSHTRVRVFHIYWILTVYSAILLGKNRENTKDLDYGPFVRESTSDHWIPLTKNQ